ncbi:pyridoxamine 5'-phosphate oxidase family protein [Streptomyces paromomycinus]|uniref:Pyridoxamine 5'-phosphate oxidase n=1 Tax=Streptomyces paromomycinus TaxID=92743 RepID=A0A401W742_STREY|nr:pyridoxamine 5'-phosphate oxidase family protein [Streptomyces paromomycinus]GCD45136.1 pyridoxamine 5'-phosphate oxidase [Streptomyces paromomycinus]
MTSDKTGTSSGDRPGRTAEGADWAGFLAAQPELAGQVEARFAAYRHHVLGTLRADGSPRLSGIEADIRSGELWLGMMANSRKALDLRRDPRFALHANPGPGTDMAGGDVRVAGRAVEVTDPAVLARYVDAAKPPEPFHLFRAELTEVVRTYVEDPHIVLEAWRPGGPLRVIRRGNGDEPPEVTVASA